MKRRSFLKSLVAAALAPFTTDVLAQQQRDWVNKLPSLYYADLTLLHTPGVFPSSAIDGMVCEHDDQLYVYHNGEWERFLRRELHPETGSYV